MILKEDNYSFPGGKNRPLHIYLPDEYDFTSERYPVMYFFDGHNLFFDQDATYGTCWGLKEFLDCWDKPLIIVGIECGHEGYERLREYCPYYFPKRYQRGEWGTGKETMDWIVNVIKPMIDSRFRTWSHREATAIAGSSMGGLMALYAVEEYNHIFSKAACLSSAIGFCIYSLRKTLRTNFINPDTRVYMSWGEKEARPKTEKHHELLRQEFEACSALVWQYRQTNGGHCEADWAKQVPYFMDFLWK